MQHALAPKKPNKMSNKTQRNKKQKIEKHLRVPSFVLGLKKASSAANAARDQNRKLNKKNPQHQPVDHNKKPLQSDLIPYQGPANYLGFIFFVGRLECLVK